jgi:hypothetical protein
LQEEKRRHHAQAAIKQTNIIVEPKAPTICGLREKTVAEISRAIAFALCERRHGKEYESFQ